MNPETIIANLRDLHRQSRLTPENHEAVRESISVLSSLLGLSETNSEMTPQVALTNIVTLYNRVPLSLEEYEVIRQSLAIIATRLPKEQKTDEAGASGSLQEKKKK
jgi:hypothetical protein